MRRLLLPLLFTLPCCTENTSAPSRNRAVYGDDDRQELHEVSSLWRERAASVALFINKADLVRSGEVTRLNTEPLTEMGVCSNELYATQPMLSAGSGFLIAPDVMVTAAHVVEGTEGCGNMAIVFDFAYDTKDKPHDAVTQVAAEDVFFCKEVIAERLEDEGADFAVIRLDRAAEGRVPLQFRLSGEPKPGAALTLIGHPAGLPMKVAAGDSTIRKVEKGSGFFVADLDSFAGNSGSPVFDSATGLVEGILVRGHTDFEEGPNGCLVTTRCATGDCRGEDATRMSALVPQIGEVLVERGLANTRTLVRNGLDSAIPDADPNGVSFSLENGTEGELLGLSLLLDFEHTYPHDVFVHVTAPDGSRLDANVSGFDPHRRGVLDLGGRLVPRAGETLPTSARGTWTVSVSDESARDVGRVYGIELKMFVRP